MSSFSKSIVIWSELLITVEPSVTVNVTVDGGASSDIAQSVLEGEDSPATFSAVT